ncbi:hypothetical protein J0X15_12340 [Roseibium sp. CAU 1637]|uniref:Uncharacterized protein n=1 Tax=Roseibium limicola TaxID=2816037 RepID=A0A939J9K9_9HYPH|nr:hypothetical protein [Roseibium limicola]MBO0346014.1 hypothetical protein [Roseibium limicola]
MPIQLELRVTAGTPVQCGRDYYWSVIRDLGKENHFTRAEIAKRANDPLDKGIDDFLRRLKKAGYIETVDTIEGTYGLETHKGKIRREVYRLLRRPSATPILNQDGTAGVLGLGQLNMWTAMRSLPQFTKQELAVTSSTDDVLVTVKSAQSYAGLLEKTGYLQVLRPGGAAVARIWRLKPSMNTGPDAPKILKSKMVYDPNRREIMGRPLAQECAA